jgi:hypothetical protein
MVYNEPVIAMKLFKLVWYFYGLPFYSSSIYCSLNTGPFKNRTQISLVFTVSYEFQAKMPVI